MTTLYSYRQDGMPLEAALAVLSAHDLQGYCISPAAFRFARCRHGKPEFAQALELDQIYEARFFDAGIELRWLRDPVGNGVGTAVLLTEGAVVLDEWEALTPLTVEALPDSPHLMTGTVGEATADDPAGWLPMDAPRHGKVLIPIETASKGERPAWIVREYLGATPGTAGDDGNRMVIEERIVGIGISEEKK